MMTQEDGSFHAALVPDAGIHTQHDGAFSCRAGVRHDD